MMKIVKYSILFFLILFIGSFVYLNKEINRPNQKIDEITIDIEPGKSLGFIANYLKEKGLIDNILVFKIYSKLSGNEKLMKSGEFLIPPKSSIREIVNIIVNGEPLEYKITFPEGLIIEQIIEKLNNQNKLVGKVSSKIKEGTLFPETYSFRKRDKRADIIRRMQKKMQEIVDEAWEKRSPELPLKNKEEMVILASIIEKETALDKEKPHIAGVYINRLRKGMALQSDPTVIYGLHKKYKRPLNQDLSTKELKIKTGYNTYMFRGLPIGAICCPGRTSIMAAANPNRTDDLYFVADGNGGHVFAKNLKDHNKNHAKWRKIRDNK